MTSFSVFCILPSCNCNHWRVNTYQSLFFFHTFYPSSICIICDYNFNIISWLNCQISSSLDLFLTEYKFLEFLIIIPINLHTQGLFNLTSESQKFSPREIYKGSWRCLSSVGFDLVPKILQTFSSNISLAIEGHTLDLSCFLTVAHCKLLLSLLLVLSFLRN